MPDFDAIATAIAARYAPAQVTPPAGLGNVRVASTNLPNRLTVLPAVMVFPDQGTFPGEGGGHGTRLGRSTFLVRFYFAVTKDLPRELNACRRWLTILVDQLKPSLQLGGIVVSAAVLSWRIVSMSYAGVAYTGIELGVSVQTSEPWSPTS